MPGTLFVVATPIGNLEDITLRALKVLREVDLVACEDTRQTAKLLGHYQIRKPTTSYHEYNETEKATSLLKLLQLGKKIALVTDSGTPCISDPGYRIIRSALEQGVKTVPIPGPCSLIAALSVSGRPTDSFSFLGFLPSRKNVRRSLLQTFKAAPSTLIFYEAPRRLLDSLADLEDILGPRDLSIARELTKVHEEVFSGSIAEARHHFSLKPVKGEIVLIVERLFSKPVPLSSFDASDLEAKLAKMVASEHLYKKEAVKRLSHQLKISKRELYQLLVSKKLP
jgi:16S rRNA (cytidine1402-2'-O)-methyltransferase